MTEYDYDPEAYEAYMKQTERVARWVDEIKHSPRQETISTSAAPIDKTLTFDYGLDDDDDADDVDRVEQNRDYKDRQQESDEGKDCDQELEADHCSDRPSSRPHAGGTLKPVKRRFYRTACIECRLRNIKCDGVKPKCGPCTSLSIDFECCGRQAEIYVDKKRHYIEELMLRIELLNLEVPDVVKKAEQSLSMFQGQDITVHDGKFTNVAGDYHEHKNTIIVLQGEKPAKTSEPAAKMSAASECLWKLFSPSKSEPDLPALERIAWRTWCDTLKNREEPHFNSLNDPPPVDAEDGNIIYETPTPDNDTAWSPEHRTSIPPPNQDFIWVLLPYVTNYFSSWCGWFQSWAYAWVPTLPSWAWPSTLFH